MRLGLRGLARAVGGAFGTCAVALVVAAALSALGAGGIAMASDGSSSWKVTVGPASQLLYPGTDATMPYEVRNATGGTLHLHGTTTELKVDSDACPAHWFHVASNDVPADVDVPPGGAVIGSIVLTFDDTPVDQDACRNVGIEVVVNAS